jgi:hypothetical protein
LQQHSFDEEHMNFRLTKDDLANIKNAFESTATAPRPTTAYTDLSNGFSFVIEVDD